MPALASISCETTGETFRPGATFGAGCEAETARLEASVCQPGGAVDAFGLSNRERVALIQATRAAFNRPTAADEIVPLATAPVGGAPEGQTLRQLDGASVVVDPIALETMALRAEESAREALAAEEAAAEERDLAKATAEAEDRSFYRCDLYRAAGERVGKTTAERTRAGAAASRLRGAVQTADVQTRAGLICFTLRRDTGGTTFSLLRSDGMVLRLGADLLPAVRFAATLHPGTAS